MSGRRVEDLDAPPRGGLNIALAVRRSVSRHPSAPAVSSAQSTWTYAELWQAVCTWAAWLGHRVVAGDRVICLAGNEAEVLALYIATAGVGAVFVPLSEQLSAREIGELVQRTNARMAIVSASFAELWRQAGEGCAHVPETAPLERPREAGDMEFREFPEDTGALICFTSGSTDKPKGVFASHGNEVESARQYGRVWDVSERDRMLVALPLSFLYGLTTACLTALCAGAHVLLEERFNPRRVLQRMTDDQATVFMGVPTMYAMMLQVGLEDLNAFDLTSVRLLLTAGAPIAEPTLAAFRSRFGRSVMDFYALSEVRPVFAFDVRRHAVPRPGSCGHRLPGVDVRLIDGDGRDVTAPGTPGELLVRSRTLMTGYYGDPVRTASAVRDGWFATGDLATFDDDGYFSIVGRKKDLIIRGGYNVAPAEVESALLRHPDVVEAAVFGVPDDVFGEEIAAALVLRPGVSVCPEDVVGFVREHLAEYKLPRAIKYLPALPKGTTGKVRKEEIRRTWIALPSPPSS